MLLDELHKIPIDEVISETTKLIPSGKNFVAICPFHEDSHPSLSVDLEKGLYYCFGCNKGGDVIQFVRDYYNMNFQEAVEFLAIKFGLTIEAFRESEYSKIMRMVTEHYHAHLNDSEDAINYLKLKGINKSCCEKWMIGYAGKNNIVLDLLKEFDPSLILGISLVKEWGEQKHMIDFFHNRVIFPIYGLHGEIVGFGGRTMDDDPRKYMNSNNSKIFDKGKTLYGINNAKRAIRDKDYAILVEGYLDVISLDAIGMSNVVSCMGTKLTPNQSLLLRRFTDKIVIALDGDPEGIKAQERAVQIFWENGFAVKMANLPDGKDPNDLVNVGKRETKEVFRTTISPVKYFLSKEKDQLKRRELGKLLEKLIIGISDNVYREDVINEYCAAIHLPRSKFQQKVVIKKQQLPDNSLAEKKLAYFITQDYRFAQIARDIVWKDFINCPELATILNNVGETEPDWSDYSPIIAKTGFLVEGNCKENILLQVQSKAIAKKIESLKSLALPLRDLLAQVDICNEQTKLIIEFQRGRETFAETVKKLLTFK